MTTTVTTAVDRFLDAVAASTIADCDAWADDAVLDATVPNWRFRLVGPDAIRAEYAGWFADPGAFVELERESVEDGEVVRYLLSWQEAGVAHVAHHLHLLRVRDGRIVRDTVVCGGRWPQPLLDDMAASQAALDARPVA